MGKIDRLIYQKRVIPVHKCEVRGCNKKFLGPTYIGGFVVNMCKEHTQIYQGKIQPNIQSDIKV